MMVAFRSAVRVIVFVLLFAPSWLPLSAQDSTPDATVQPNRAISFYPEDTGAGTFITLEIDAGESGTANIVIGNSGDIEQTLRTYAVPAFSGVNGGFVLRDYGAELDAVTSWLDYSEAFHTFAPGEGLSVPVTVTVPDDAEPGEYVTGLAAEQDDSFEVPGTDMVRQRVRWSIPILIVIPGDRSPDFELVDATLENRDGVYIAEIGIANTGNVIVRPAGEVRLLDANGTVVGVASLALDSVYTGTETTFIVAWDSVPPSDTYSLEVALTNEEGQVKVEKQIDGLVPFSDGDQATPVVDPLTVSRSELTPATTDSPPSLLLFNGEISNNGEAIEDARVSIVTYKDGEEVDRYPILQAVTIQQGTTPVEARYSLPGGFTEGTYTFEVTIELGDMGSQTVLVTQPIDFEVTVP